MRIRLDILKLDLPQPTPSPRRGPALVPTGPRCRRRVPPAGIRTPRLMPDNQEQTQRDRPKDGKLCVTAGHAVPFAHSQLCRSFLFNEPFERKVESLAGHLAREHEDDLSFTGRPYQGHVDDAEGLGYEGEEGAEVGDWVVRVLEG